MGSQSYEVRGFHIPEILRETCFLMDDFPINSICCRSFINAGKWDDYTVVDAV